jgi:hypothetical protein
MRTIFLFTGFLILLCFNGEVFAQQSGTVQVIKDPQIDSLIARRLVLSRAASKTGTSGFRVQIFSGPDRKNAYTVQTKFKSLYPNIRSYVSYNQPNYRVRVGDFRTRLEAQKTINKLKRHYQTLFIFPERINLR